MSAPRVLVMIDQAARDAYSQLLVVHHLRSKGAKVLTCNQITWAAAWERYRPDVAYISWVGGMFEEVRKMKHRAEIVLIDHEGGRLGKIPFKRSFERPNDPKAELGRACSLAVSYGPIQKKWLAELGLLPPEKVVVTGSPRLDPYMTTSDSPRRFIGFTLRADVLTATPKRFVQNLFDYARMDPRDWISPGYAQTAQQEDRIWHITASLRYMLKIMIEVRKRSDIPIVARPGPWEQYAMYHFLKRELGNLTVESWTSQPDYVRSAFAVVDESSSLGLEALIAGTPVVSIHNMIPHYEERIGGSPDAGLFYAPFKKAYWAPASVEEAADLLLRGAKGGLAISPDPTGMNEYLGEFHSWPRSRPSSFQIGDGILELAKRRSLYVTKPPSSPIQRTTYEAFKTNLFRYVPGSVNLLKARFLLRMLFSEDRTHLRKYHYVALFYRHRSAVRKLFRRLKLEFGPR